MKTKNGNKNRVPVFDVGSRKKSGKKNQEPEKKMGALGFEPRSAGIHM